MKYRIKNPEIEKIVKALFVSEGAYQSVLDWTCKTYMDGESSFICLEADTRQSVTGGICNVCVSKNDIEEVHEYSHKKWNPYPQVKPPKDDLYRVQMTLPDFEVRRFMLEWRDGKWRVDYLPEHQELLFKPWDDEENEE